MSSKGGRERKWDENKINDALDRRDEVAAERRRRETEKFLKQWDADIKRKQSGQ